MRRGGKGGGSAQRGAKYFIWGSAVHARGSHARCAGRRQAVRGAPPGRAVRSSRGSPCAAVARSWRTRCGVGRGAPQMRSRERSRALRVRRQPGSLSRPRRAQRWRATPRSPHLRAAEPRRTRSRPSSVSPSSVRPSSSSCAASLSPAAAPGASAPPPPAPCSGAASSSSSSSSSAHQALPPGAPACGIGTSALPSGPRGSGKPVAAAADSLADLLLPDSPELGFMASTFRRGDPDRQRVRSGVRACTARRCARKPALTAPRHQRARLQAGANRAPRRRPRRAR